MTDNDRVSSALAVFLKSIDDNPICTNLADYQRIMYNAMAAALLCAISKEYLEDTKNFIQSNHNILQ